MSEGTENNQRMRSKRGAFWTRADFHLHTIKERGASRKDYRAEFAGKEEEFPKAFVDKLEEQQIRVAAITNHNAFDLDEYQRIARKGRRKNILVLPGIELGMRGGKSTIHALVIFDPENLASDNDFIARFLDGVFPSGRPEEGSATTGDLADCIERLEALKQSYFIVFAHVESDNGLLKDMTKTALQPIYELIGKETWERRVLGFQGVKSDLHWIAQKLPEGMPIPAFVEGSDPETSIEQVGRDDHGICFRVAGLSRFAWMAAVDPCGRWVVVCGGSCWVGDVTRNWGESLVVVAAYQWGCFDRFGLAGDVPVVRNARADGGDCGASCSGGYQCDRGAPVVPSVPF